MNNYESFGRKVLEILVSNMNWDVDVVIEIAELAERMELATCAADGEFEVV